jgi:hypothetical protein
MKAEQITRVINRGYYKANIDSDYGNDIGDKYPAKATN